MSTELSPKTRALLDAARGDGPAALSRDSIWSGVSAATAAKSAAAAATAVGAQGSASGLTLLTFGTLLGSVATIGTAAVLFALRPSGNALSGDPASIHRQPPAALVADARPGSRLPDAPLAGPPAPLEASREVRTAGTCVAGESLSPRSDSATAANMARPSKAAHESSRRPDRADDVLMHEAFLIAEARGALSRGNATAALLAIRAAKRLADHELEPEELAVEAQALRALSKTEDADAVEALLRRKYPDHALAR